MKHQVASASQVLLPKGSEAATGIARSLMGQLINLAVQAGLENGISTIDEKGRSVDEFVWLNAVVAGHWAVPVKFMAQLRCGIAGRLAVKLLNLSISVEPLRLWLMDLHEAVQELGGPLLTLITKDGSNGGIKTFAVVHEWGFVNDALHSLNPHPHNWSGYPTPTDGEVREYTLFDDYSGYEEQLLRGRLLGHCDKCGLPAVHFRWSEATISRKFARCERCNARYRAIHSSFIALDVPKRFITTGCEAATAVAQNKEKRLIDRWATLLNENTIPFKEGTAFNLPSLHIGDHLIVDGAGRLLFGSTYEPISDSRRAANLLFKEVQF